MYRNAKNHFAINPQIDTPRSTFPMGKKHTTTFNVGQLIPFYCKLVYPGDTVSMNTRFVVRTTTPIKSPMDVSYLDTYYFYIPLRILWEHFPEFMGENKLTPWEQPTEYKIPQITAPEGGWAAKTLADHLGIKPGVSNVKTTALKGRAYAMIWREWFRDQNLQEGTMINTDDANIIGSNGDNYITDLQLLGKPANVCKFHDYFTSCLPKPQKGPEITIPLGTIAPVYPRNEEIPSNLLTGVGVMWGKEDGSTPLDGNSLKYDSASKTMNFTNTTGQSGGYGIATTTNLWTDLTNATASSINSLRQAFAVQQLFEKDARGGTRYKEIVKSHFGVNVSDARVQIPEYLGGGRTPMNITQVVQMSGTTEVSPQGNIAGFSLTTRQGHSFTKSFDEHGYIMGVCCVRCNHTYQEGIAREDSYTDRLEFYWPTLNGIGEQAVLNKEIQVTGTEVDDEVFGYQERYAECRTDFNTLAGEFRDNYAQSLKYWLYADYYGENQPVLGPTWIQETPENMDKTLQVSSTISDQIHADFYMDATFTRPMPLYSIPGLSRM